jgi:RNA polymerase sigma-70 factor (ECF subfamily)
MAATQETNAALAGATRFNTTHWSVVVNAAEDSSPNGQAALETLCRTYWYPLYAFIRRRGCQPAEAQDLTQAFFARLLEKGYLRGVDRRKGKFRSFLLAALEHFLANEWRNARAQKRGGGVVVISLDDTSAEQQYERLPASDLSPEKLFEQQWATTLLDQAIVKLRDEFRAEGKAVLFDRLKIFLTGEKRSTSYASLATELATTEAALKMAVSRMRQRYGELLRAEIAHTVSTPEEVEEELKALFAALSA